MAESEQFPVGSEMMGRAFATPKYSANKTQQNNGDEQQANLFFHDYPFCFAVAMVGEKFPELKVSR